MPRLHQLLFIISLFALCWLTMLAVHELGHVVGAAITGGTIEQVVLYPLAISRTDVSPNPFPAMVVWFGPIIGCVLPLLFLAILARSSSPLRKIVQFFAGFCLIANGTYIAIGSFDRIGDCREMARTGTPVWGMLLFGAITIPLGLFLWHRLGSLKHFLRTPSQIAPQMTCLACCLLFVLVTLGFLISPR
jgi:hypothetical protein